MNKTLLTILLLTLALALGAQTGLFDISYGMSIQEAIDHMEEEGFTITDETEDWLELVPIDNYYVEKMELSFSEDGEDLQSWSITYLPVEDEDIEELVMDALVERHGDYYEWDEYMEEYYWELDDSHWVYAGWDWDWETFWVDYTTE